MIRQRSFLAVAEPKDRSLIDESAVVRQHNLRVNAEMESGQAGDPGSGEIHKDAQVTRFA